MLSNVMPQRGVFFSLLATLADRMVAAANANMRLISALGNPNAPSQALIEEVNANAKSAEEIKAELIKLLYESFTTPINRDQIHTLTLDLDRVIEALQDAANRVSIYSIQQSTAASREMASLGVDACMRLSRAVAALGERQREHEIVRQCKKVDHIEERASEVMRLAITRLFAKEGDEDAAWHAMRMHDFYFRQADVLDRAKRASKTLEEILIENA